MKGIQIKGIREGLLITLGEGDWTDLRSALLAQIEQQAAFFQGARLAVDVGNQVLHAAEMGSLRDVLSDRGLQLWAILGRSPITEQTAQMLGLATRLPSHKIDRIIRSSPSNIQDDPEGATLVHRTLRSGLKLEKQGHVVVIGDVNPGAEILAGGSIVVWGKLRGLAHAGINGDENAVVCALELDPTTLRIAGVTATPPKKKGKVQASAASLKDGEIVIRAWDTKVK